MDDERQQLLRDFSHVDPLTLADVLEQLTERPVDQIRETLTTMFPPPPEGFQAHTNSIVFDQPITIDQLMNPTGQSGNLFNQLLGQMFNGNFVNAMAQAINANASNDKDLINDIILNPCNSVTCYTCKEFAEYYGTWSEKYGSKYEEAVSAVIDDAFGSRYHFCINCVDKAYQQLPLLMEKPSVKHISNEFGDCIAAKTVAIIGSKLLSLFKFSIEHLTCSMVRLLRQKKVTIQYAMSFNLPPYELDEFLPKDQRKGMDDEMLESFRTKVKSITEKTDETCTICINPLHHEEEQEDGSSKKLTPVQLFCRHEFHWECISEHLKINAECPLCKKSFKSDVIEDATEVAEEAMET